MSDEKQASVETQADALPYLEKPSPCLLNLDRKIRWTHGLAFVSHGVSCGVRVTQSEGLDAVRTALPPGWQPAESLQVKCLFSYQVGGVGPRANVRKYHLVYDNITQMSRTHDQAEALQALEGIIQLCVGYYAEERVFIHAGVVGYRGQAILIPARSCAGKSTLVEALLKAGATYYSDEYAVLDKEGRVWPYARRLALRQPLTPVRVRSSADELGAETGVEPLPVGMVAFTRYRDGARWSPRQMAGGKAALGLFNHAVGATRDAEHCLSAIQRVAEQARCCESSRGDAEETAERILSAIH